jgi:hypothetical protein
MSRAREHWLLVTVGVERDDGIHYGAPRLVCDLLRAAFLAPVRRLLRHPILHRHGPSYCCYSQYCYYYFRCCCYWWCCTAAAAFPSHILLYARPRVVFQSTTTTMCVSHRYLSLGSLGPSDAVRRSFIRRRSCTTSVCATSSANSATTRRVALTPACAPHVAAGRAFLLATAATRRWHTRSALTSSTSSSTPRRIPERTVYPPPSPPQLQYESPPPPSFTPSFAQSDFVL